MSNISSEDLDTPASDRFENDDRRVGRDDDQDENSPKPSGSNFFEGQSTTRIFGLFVVLALLISGTITFFILIGLTSFDPTNETTAFTAVIVNGGLSAILLILISREIAKILSSRKKGRAASRLHVRLITLFSLVAAIPAIIVAIVAGVTLDIGLDRWFEIRTKNIINSSVSVAVAYMNESTRSLMGNTINMASDLDRNRRLFALDRKAFNDLVTLHARARGFVTAELVRNNGVAIVRAELKTERSAPPVHKDALEAASSGDPVNIPRGKGNFVGAVLKLKNISNAYLYTVVALPDAVINALQETEDNVKEYGQLENTRLPVQFAYAILYIGLCLIVLLAAIWMGISVADRIVSPIRRLIFAASEVSSGNLDVSVNTSHSEGDLMFLSEKFNVMIADLKYQRTLLISAHDEMNHRALFTEAVLSGVSAAVIGIDIEGRVTLANRIALELLSDEAIDFQNPQLLANFSSELDAAFQNAVVSGKTEYHEQITLLRSGRERTLNMTVTLEGKETEDHSYVVTIDDITNLVVAQRNNAWADVAQRIAHEIKNPLTPIQLSAERIRRRFGKQIINDREIFDQCTDTIVRQVSHIGRMVDEFSSFARMPAPEFTNGDLQNVVRETVFLQKVGFPDIEFTTEYEKNPIYCEYDARLLSQALINVLKNAAEAIEAVPADEMDAGKITVRVHKDDNRAMIDIIDNGKGLPKENRQRLLEPYMTTREKGTGLGLAIVRKVMEDHGGNIELMDAPDVTNGVEGARGALMRLSIRLASTDSPDETTPPDSAEDKNKNNETDMSVRA